MPVADVTHCGKVHSETKTVRKEIFMIRRSNQWIFTSKRDLLTVVNSCFWVFLSFFSQVRASILIEVCRAPLFEYNFLIMTRWLKFHPVVFKIDTRKNLLTKFDEYNHSEKERKNVSLGRVICGSLSWFLRCNRWNKVSFFAVKLAVHPRLTILLLQV